MPERPEEPDQRKFALLVEVALGCEILSALNGLAGSEETHLAVGLLALFGWLAASCNSRES
ncbi:hypothetical protein ACFFMR_31365 [Micromonospora andamanensis]|uniref:Uncharacterized protein n=1 Tax=Micromonospora andamanensis TaxID=1287068 RepID=A0ABQ4I5P1_9ACTN|nr:hypothetical protein [Micromonospora andamanensis]GIJ13220.1 hypothetical protein Van01_64340 [Micromonospora andamanensis]